MVISQPNDEKEIQFMSLTVIRAVIFIPGTNVIILQRHKNKHFVAAVGNDEHIRSAILQLCVQSCPQHDLLTLYHLGEIDYIISAHQYSSLPTSTLVLEHDNERNESNHETDGSVLYCLSGRYMALGRGFMHPASLHFIRTWIFMVKSYRRFERKIEKMGQEQETKTFYTKGGGKAAETDLYFLVK